MIVLVQIRLQRKSADGLDAFTQAVKNIPEVEECHLVSGNFDYLVKARVKDMTAYRELLGGKVLQLPGVQESTSYPVMESVVDGPLIYDPA